MVSDKWTHGCRGVLSPLPDLWAAQWDGRQLEPLKDYLDLSQACWDNLGAKSLCSFHINLQGGGWHMGKEQSITHCVCDRECVCCGMCLWLVNIPPLRHKFSSILQQFSALDDTFRFWYQTTAHHLFFIKDAEWFNLEVWSVYKQICISFFFFLFFFQPISHTWKNVRIINRRADAGWEQRDRRTGKPSTWRSLCRGGVTTQRRQESPACSL